MKRVLYTLIAVIIALAVGISIGTALKRPISATVTPPALLDSDLLSLVNAERARNGVTPLKEDARLDASAQQKASDMYLNNYYAHISPITNKDSHDFIFNTGISCVDSSENIEENSSDSTAVQAWIKSPSHHKAMIDPAYSLTGFGIAGKDKSGYYLFVEHFCQTP
jgi:uncharacterized protein YkwD